MLRSFTVTPVLNGFIVQVGCQTVVFQTVEELVATINRYLLEPGTVTEKFLATSINAQKIGPQIEPAPCNMDRCSQENTVPGHIIRV